MPLEPDIQFFESRTAMQLVARKWAVPPQTRASLLADGITVKATLVLSARNIKSIWWLDRNGLTIRYGEPQPRVPQCHQSDSPCSSIFIDAAPSPFVNFEPYATVTSWSDDGLAVSVELEVHVTVDMNEGKYPFTVQLPVTDNVTWSYRNLSGILEVTSRADAAMSEADTNWKQVQSQTGSIAPSIGDPPPCAQSCQSLSMPQNCMVALRWLASGCAMSCSESDANSILDMLGCIAQDRPDTIHIMDGGMAPIQVSIAARDIAGIDILRDGELLQVNASCIDGSQVVQAKFSGSSNRYEAEIGGLTVVGRCTFRIQTSTGTSQGFEAEVVCAPGFQEAGRQCVPWCKLAKATAADSIVETRFVTGEELALSALGSATTVSLLQKTATFAVAADRTASLRFDRPGTFVAQIRLSDDEACTLDTLLTVTSRADAGNTGPPHLLDAGRCAETDGFRFDELTQQCKRRPLMAVTASTKLSLTVKKKRSSTILNTTAEIRLVSGDISGSLLWTARSSAGWLRLVDPSGSVNSSNPVATLHLVADASEISDTGLSGPLSAVIEVETKFGSASNGETSLFLNGSSLVSLLVELVIEAEAELLPSDVAIRTSRDIALPPGGAIISGDALTVSVQAYDFQRLRITQPRLPVTLSLGVNGAACEASKARHFGWFLNKSVTGDLSAAGYIVDVPSNWTNDPGSYTICVQDVSSPKPRLEIQFVVSPKPVTNAPSTTALPTSVPSRAATPAPSAETPITERPIIFQILLGIVVVSTAFEKLHSFCFSAWLMICPRLLCPGGRGRGRGRMEIEKETKEGAEGAAGC